MVDGVHFNVYWHCKKINAAVQKHIQQIVDLREV